MRKPRQQHFIHQTSQVHVKTSLLKACLSLFSGQSLRRLTLFALIAAITSSSLLSAFLPSQSVSADPSPTVTISSKFTIEQEIKSLSYYQTLIGCVYNNMHATIQIKGTDNANAVPSTWFDDNTANGYIYPSGIAYCKDIAVQALSLWGYKNNALFLASIGYTYDANTAIWSQPSGDESTRLLAFELAVNTNVYGRSGSSYRPTLSDGAHYIMASTYFRSTACSAQDLGLFSTITNPTIKGWVDAANSTFRANDPAAGVVGIDTGSVTYIKVPIVTPEKKTDVHGYVYQSSNLSVTGGGKGTAVSGGKTYAILYGYHDENYNGGPKKESCDNLAKDLIGYAPKYIAWLNKLENGAAVVAPLIKDDICTNNGNCAPKTSCAIEGIGWIICPVITFLANIADASFGFLANNFLKTDPQVFNTTSSAFAAWSVMRSIANVAFVIVFLIIIFSQLTSFGVSNYGVKKMLPRLVVAAILVNLSFFVSQLAIDVSNILGYSLKDLFDSIPIKAPDGTALSDTTTGGGFAGVAGTVIAISVAGVASYALLSTLIPIILAAVVALIMILFILVARQAIVILLVVVSPLAFVAFLLPNTESLFKQWRKMLTSMLLLFPIIALVFGASTLASKILSTAYTNGVTGGDGNMFAQIIASAVLVLPLFAVPVLLKKSLDGIPVLGQMASKFAGRANGNLGKKLNESYATSAVGMGRALRKQGAENYRKRRFAEKSGKGGLYGTLSKGIPGTAQARAANKAVGRYASAAVDKAESEDIQAEQGNLERRILSDTTGATTADTAFTEAMQKGDTVAARAALNIKFQTAGGRTESHDLIAAAEADPSTKPGKIQELQRHISRNHPSMDTQDNTLSRWSHGLRTASGDGNITALEKDTETYKLADQKMAGQAKKGLVEAFNASTLDHDSAARILGSEVLSKDLKTDEREFLEYVKTGAPATAGGPATPVTLRSIDKGFR